MSDTLSTATYRAVLGLPAYRVGDDGSVWSCYERNTRPGAEGRALGDKWHRIKPNPTPRDGVYRVNLAVGVKKRKWFSVGRLVLLTLSCKRSVAACWLTVLAVL